LNRLEIDTCFISLFTNDNITNELIPYYIRLDNKENSETLSNPKYLSNLILPDTYIPSYRYSFVLLPLFFYDWKQGIILFKYKFKFQNSYENLRTIISCALKGKALVNKLNEEKRNTEEKNIALEAISLRDELTGLYNRRGFFTLGEKELKKAQKEKKNFIVLYFDLDGLKHINDTFGHEEGDYAINSAAKIINSILRNEDIPARLGGDEFVAITLNTDIKSVQVILNRLKKKLKDFNYYSNKTYDISFSYGYSEYTPEKSSSLNELLKEADEMLYNTKKRKKNQRGKE
jgi:diguanylate cyclase (GGDEF)-like protein